MKIGIIQMSVDFDKSKNLEKMANYVKKAKEIGADLAILPEMFNCPYSNKYFADYAEEKGGESYTALSKAAADNGIYLVGGSIPEKVEEDNVERIYNTSFVFDKKGDEMARHRKVHLFDIDVKDGWSAPSEPARPSIPGWSAPSEPARPSIPGQKFFESETFTGGEDITVFDTEFGKMGLVICFDIRFPEICRLTALKGAKVLFAPGAFNMTTGPLHWEILFRLRAVDNQLYTVGASPARDENGVYVSYANSIAVDPWGRVIYRADEKESIQVVDLDLEEIERVREQLPLINAMRKDVYRIEEK
ncbi:MAG: carbon-nitrogen hydrolase family protein [Defluviitaleaceae bacterium]|nr:carbon-nitrogen hydrolase family protein [Defluviitaleaceae bacterium]